MTTPPPTSGPANRNLARTMTEMTIELLESLSERQRSAASFDFDDAERRVWFYTPTDHGGLGLGAMSPTQHRHVWKLVAIGLSEPGYNTAAVIAGMENILDRVEGFQVDWGFERGRDPLRYQIAIFGTPGSRRWGWRFGGHHLSLNFTILDGEVRSSTPCFMGADPASSTLLGPHLLRPLGGAEDTGRELARSLTGEHAATAILSPVAPPDLMTSNRSVLADGDESLPLPLIWRGRFEHQIDELLTGMQQRLEAGLGWSPEASSRLAFTRQPKGVPVAALNDGQRQMVDAVIGCYVNRIDDALADEAWTKAQAQADRLHFLWAGSLEPGEPHYYRLQGGDLFIEYDNAQRGGNHVHTVWRDLSTDFGDPLAEHYAASVASAASGQGHVH